MSGIDITPGTTKGKVNGTLNREILAGNLRDYRW